MVQGQGHEVKVVGQLEIKAVVGVLYPTDSREVRHTGIFIKNIPFWYRLGLVYKMYDWDKLVNPTCDM